MPSKYFEEWDAQGRPSYTSFAQSKGLNESTIRHSIKRHLYELQTRENAEPAVLNGMDTLGFTGQPHSGWIKSETPDSYGNTYSYYFLNKPEEESFESKLDLIAERFQNVPPIMFIPPTLPTIPRIRKAFISISDLHSGALAWGKETGFGDWDLEIAMTRLKEWLIKLFVHIKNSDVHEIILYYNGDTLHSNGSIPMTSTAGTAHILDVDNRQFKVVDTTTEQIIFCADLAAQIANVQLVIKRGNHDGDSHLALLQGAKWRYYNQPNVHVDMNPGPYWVHIFGKVALFGHHGDKIKPDVLIMNFLHKYRKEISDVEHVTVWTGDKHHRKVEQFPGVIWEQASNWSEPDEYGSKWGSNAMAQAVIYDELEGETARFTVKASQIFGG